MIISEHYETLPDGKELIRTYSDEHFYIQKVHTAELYEEAIDIAPTPYYVETDIKIPEEEEPEEETEIPAEE